MSNILIVDDEPGIRYTVSAFLKDDGHTPFTAQTVDEALTVLASSPIDVVICDVLLPFRPGTDLLKEVRHRWPRVQCILLTGRPDLDSAGAAIRHRAFDYLTKPVPIPQLLSTVAEAAAVKHREDEHDRLEQENRAYRESLERMVEQRTAQLRASEEKHRGLLENLNDIVFELNREGLVTYASPVVQRVAGYTPEELVGRFYGDLIHPEDWAQVRTTFEDTLKGNTHPCDFRLTKKSGDFVWARSSTCPVQGPDGQAVGIRGVLTDISDRQRTEERLRQSEERYRAMVENQMDVICRFRPDGTFLFVNEVYGRLFGVKPDDLIGLTWHPRVLAEDTPMIEARLRALSPSNPVVVIENRIRAADGAVHWMQFVNRGLFDARGELVEVQAVGRDITALKRAETALQRRQEELQAIYDHAPVMLCVLDENRKVVFANRAFEEYAGRANDSLFAQAACGVLGCCHSIDDPRGCGFGPRCGSCALFRALQDTIATGHSHRNVEHATAIIRAGHRVNAVWLGATTRIESESRPLVLLALQDITERKDIELQLRQSERQLADLSRRLVELQETERRDVARELHDRAGPSLTALNLNLTLLQRLLPADATETMVTRLDDSLRLVAETMDNLRTVMTDLRPPVLDDYGLPAALQWYAKQFEQRTGLSVAIHVQEPRVRQPQNMETALFRIAQEALTNVARHARARTVAVSLESTGTTLRMTIDDDGIGFDPAAPGKPGAPATWGLATMRERAMAVGARHRVESAPGKGTRITVDADLEPSAGAATS